MNTFNADPNFSIVTPGGCNADCAFCFNKEQPPFPTIPIGSYIKNLSTCLGLLDQKFYQISLTGNEPLCSPYLMPILAVIIPFKFKYTNVLLTTNGIGLLDKIDILSDSIDHINISHHHYDEAENNKIFGKAYNMTDDYIFQAIDEYGKKGIDISVNCVISDETDRDFIIKYIDWARRIGVNAIRFRKLNGNLNPTPVEAEFNEYKTQWVGTCPVCRTVLQHIRGVDVYWKSSVLEPSDTITDTIFELVFQPNGKMYKDWMGKKEYLITPRQKDIKPSDIYDDKRSSRKTTRSSGGSSSSCGGGSRGSGRC